jgi:hypothetical protein
MFHSHKPCCAHAAPLPCCNHAVLKAISQGHGTAQHGMCELMLAVERWSVSDLAMFSFIHLLQGHSQRSLTRKLLPMGMCLIILMTKETADYTEYELTFKLTPVFHCCYVTSPLCIILLWHGIPIVF